MDRFNNELNIDFHVHYKGLYQSEEEVKQSNNKYKLSANCVTM